MRKKVTMDDIAKALNVSRNTVSMSFRNSPIISPATKKAVYETAQQLGYQYKKGINDDVSQNTASLNVCLIFSNKGELTNDFYSQMYYGLEHEAKKNNINILVDFISDQNNDYKLPSGIYKGFFKGILTLGNIPKYVIQSTINTGIPFVMVDKYFNNLQSDCILADNHTGGYIATEYLIKQGHKDIAFCGKISSDNYNDRFQGYLKAMNDYAIPLHSVYAPFINHNTPEQIMEFKQLHGLPTAIFCRNDRTALKLYKNFAICGIKVPDEVSVIGFDNTFLTKQIHPELTTIHVHKNYIGKEAVRLLVSRIKGNLDPHKKILTSVELLERDSVKKI